MKRKTGRDASVTKKPHPGRPTVKAAPGVRSTVSLRLTAETKDKIDSAAKEKGRPFSHEAELRLERSFQVEGLLPEVLSLAYDPVTAGILMAIGTLMTQAGTFAMVKRLEVMRHKDVPPWEMRDLLSSIDWKKDPHAMDTALRASINFLTRLRPRPLTSEKDLPGAFAEWIAQFHAFELAKILKDKDNPASAEAAEIYNFRHLDLVRILLGNFVSRIDSERVAGWSDRETRGQEDVPAKMSKGAAKSDGDGKKAHPTKR